MSALTILTGDCRESLRTVAAGSVQCCVTSPPYWGLRSYLPASAPEKGLEMGQEKTPGEFVAALVGVFAEVWRVLRPDGTLWLNLGDSFATNRGYQVPSTKGGPKHGPAQGVGGNGSVVPEGLKPKDLCGIPWRVAFALQEAGWWLRSDIIWAKPNAMPESVRDRPTRSHEYIFLLTKSERYFYDGEAIRNPASAAMVRQVAEGYRGADTKDFLEAGAQSASGTKGRIIEGARRRLEKQRGHGRRHDGFNDRWDALSKEEQQALGSNARDVWTVAPANFRGAHFATFPPELPRRCILAGSRPGDTVLDPFGGSGTTGMVALELGRRAILCELNPAGVPMIKERCAITPGLQLQ